MATQHTAAPRIVLRQRPLVVLAIRPGRPFGTDAGQATTELAADFGWDVLDLRFTRDDLPGQCIPDGALSDYLPTDPFSLRLRALGCPTVRIGALPHPEDALFPAVLPDVAARGRMAAEHFAERGFQHMAYVGRHPWGDGQACYEALLQRAGELGMATYLLRIDYAKAQSGQTLYDVQAQQMQPWLETLPKPVGVYAFNDREGGRICAICREAGWSVPEQVAVLGTGNRPADCELAPVKLSSIDVADDERIRQAMSLLRRLMTGQPTPGAPILIAPRGVVTRRSTDMLAVADPLVAHSIRFLWDHLEQNLSVDDVAAAVGVTRRSLERAFRRNLGRGVNAELRRKRLERSRELLCSTDANIASIAPQVGFRSAAFLHASFKQAFGMTPKQFRKNVEYTIGRVSNSE